MNNESTSCRFTGWIVTAVFIFFTIAGCKKDGPTRAVITVVDSTGAYVQQASVTLWQDTVVNSTNNVQSNIRVTKQSDATGRAEFDFQLEAFLNVEVIKSGDTGRSFVRLKEHETVEQTVHL